MQPKFILIDIQHIKFKPKNKFVYITPTIIVAPRK